MVKFLIMYAIVLIAMNMYSRKNSSSAQRVLFYLHLIGGILFTGFGVFHGIGHFLSAPLRMQVTGSVMLLLLIAEITLGFFTYKKGTHFLKKAHIWLAISILCMVVLHLILLKLF